MTNPISKLTQSARLTIALLYGGLLLVILWLAYTDNLPPYLSKIPYYDKIGHLVLYSLAAFLGHRLLRTRKIRLFGFSIPLWIGLFSLITLVEEGLQGLSPNRTLDAIDLIASFTGIALGYWLAEKRGRKINRK